MKTWDDFFNNVRLTEGRIDSRYKLAKGKKDSAAARAAMNSLARLRDIVEETVLDVQFISDDRK